MCFKILKNYTKRQIAKENIICYKILQASIWVDMNPIRFISMFRHFSYELNFEYTSPLKIDRINHSEVHLGFHSYSTLDKAKKIFGGSRVFTLVECIIPSGAKYYYNPDRCEYVSDKIIINKVI